MVGGQHGHGDLPELLEFGRTVQRSGLVQGDGDLLQAGQEHQHAGAELPHAHQHDDQQGGLGVAQQGVLLLNAKGRKQAHEHALVAKHLLPHHGDGDGAAHDEGDVVQHPVESHAHVLFVQQGGHKQGEGETQRHHDKDVEEGDRKGLAEHLICGKDGDVILQTHPVGCGQQVVIREGIVDGHGSRDDIHKDEAEQPRSQQQIADLGIIAEMMLFQRNSFCVGHSETSFL